MNRALLIGFGFALLTAIPVSAQTAVRCDQGGQTAYNEKSCPSGDVGKVIAPTQDSAAQRQAAREANDQLRKDSQAIDQRLTQRIKSDAASRPAGKAPRTVADKSKSAKGDKSGTAKKHKTRHKAASAKATSSKAKRNDAVTREPNRTQP